MSLINHYSGTKTFIMAAPNTPLGWAVSVYPDVPVMIPAGGVVAYTVSITPPTTHDYVELIEVLGWFEGEDYGSPSMSWTFFIESTVPVEETTWGKIKSLYKR